MIIDGPITFDMTVGADRRIPSPADAQTEVPSSVIPVVLALKPTTLSGGGGFTLKSSTLISGALNRLNQAAATVVLAILTPGIWELEALLVTQFNYTGVVGVLNGASIELLDAVGVIVPILERIAQIGTFTDFNRIRILLLTNTTLQISADLTGVGQNLDMRGTINCIRVI